MHISALTSDALDEDEDDIQIRKPNASLIDHMHPTSFTKSNVRTEAYFSASQPRLSNKPLIKKTPLEIVDPSDQIANESPLKPSQMFSSVIGCSSIKGGQLPRQA